MPALGTSQSPAIRLSVKWPLAPERQGPGVLAVVLEVAVVLAVPEVAEEAQARYSGRTWPTCHPHRGGVGETVYLLEAVAHQCLLASSAEATDDLCLPGHPVPCPC